MSEVTAFPPTATGRIFTPPPPWTLDALCAQTDPEEFFPDKGGSVGVEAAKAICRRCLVTAECLDYALTNNEDHGVWGATTARQRRKLRALTTHTERTPA